MNNVTKIHLTSTEGLLVAQPLLQTAFKNMLSLKLQVTFILALVFTITSCKKNITPKTPEEILTGSMWQVEELRYLKNNTQYYYKRGSSANNVNYDTEYIKFENDKTGTVYGQRATVPITWAFSNPAKTSIQFTVKYQGSTPFTVTWDKITYSETSIQYTEYYVQDGVQVLSVGLRTPRL